MHKLSMYERGSRFLAPACPRAKSNVYTWKSMHEPLIIMGVKQPWNSQKS